MDNAPVALAAPAAAAAAEHTRGIGEPEVHEATGLLRDFLNVSEMFERALATDLQVNKTDLQAMEHLLMSGPLGPSELARRLGISTASTTTAIDRLVALGHVTREPNPKDRRGVLVVPQPASRERAMRKLLPMILGLDARIYDFTADEQETITRYLRSVVELYRTHAGEEIPARRGRTA